MVSPAPHDVCSRHTIRSLRAGGRTVMAHDFDSDSTRTVRSASISGWASRLALSAPHRFCTGTTWPLLIVCGAALALELAGGASSPARAGLRLLCVGDCNDDGAVAVNELVSGVGVSLGSLPLSACPAFDTDDDLQVSI